MTGNEHRNGRHRSFAYLWSIYGRRGEIEIPFDLESWKIMGGRGVVGKKVLHLGRDMKFKHMYTLFIGPNMMT